MSRVRFRFHAELRDFLPPEHRGCWFEHDFRRRTSIKDMIEALGVPHPEVAGIRVNGEFVGFDHIVRDGDRIDVHPVGDGPEPAPSERLRPSPVAMRFALDAQLGSLARWLRLAGFDTLYRNDWEDAALAELAASAPRILLSRDRNLLKRRIIVHGYFVRSDRAPEQLAEVCARFSLHGRAAPFTRCARCNGMLADVDKAQVLDRLEPLTRRYHEVFRICRDCGRVYWRGSHVRRIEQLLEATGVGETSGQAPSASRT